MSIGLEHRSFFTVWSRSFRVESTISSNLCGLGVQVVLLVWPNGKLSPRRHTSGE